MIKDLSNQLRWRNEVGHSEYERTKAAATQRLLEEVDGFVEENFQPRTAKADLVTKDLDAVMGYMEGGLTHNIAFSADLPAGRFLLLGVEIARGGPAIAEDAISFRAYKVSGNRFALAAHTRIWDDATDLHVNRLTSVPSPGEFWFFASTVVNPQTPPMVAIRLYAFGGSDFRTVWVPPDFREQVCQNCILAEGPEKALTFTSGGFVLNKLFDPTGEAAHFPTIVIHEEFVITASEPQKLNEWKTEFP